MRVRRIVDTNYNQTRRFPDGVVGAVRLKPSRLKEHTFCHACGREITSFNYSDGELYAKKEYWRAETIEGLEVHFCGWTRSCYAIQNEKASRNGGEPGA